MLLYVCCASASSQEGLKLFDLLQFLAENPSDENISRAFPSIADAEIDPQLFWAAVTTRGSDDEFDSEIWEFMHRFIDELHSGAIGT